MSFLARLARAADGSHAQAIDQESSPLDSGVVVTEIASLAAKGRYEDALRVANLALEKAPADAGLLFARGSTLLDWGRYRDACESYERAERNGLRSVNLYRHLGWAYFYAGDLDSAEQNLRRAVSLGPEDFDALFCLGVVLKDRNAFDDALAALEKAAMLRPQNFPVHLMLGNCKLVVRDVVSAEVCYRRAIEIEPASASAWVNLGTALRKQDKHADAIAAFERAEALERSDDASDADTYVSLALSYADAGRYNEARELLEANLARRPAIWGHCNYGAILLQQGRLAEGWRHFEFRWMLDDKGFKRASYGKPVWSGQNLSGKTVLIRAEQGIGDTIQFLRYASLLKTLGARVLLKAPPGLEQLGQGVSGLDEVLPPHETPVDFDFYVHALSAAAPFTTSLDSIPASVPYIHAQPDRIAIWESRLGELRGLKVGLVWAGSPQHERDRYRSISLDAFGPIIGVPGVRLISLQKGSSAADLNRLGTAVLNLGPELDDLADTAAVIHQLDLVIGVDTAVIHLAGAMGKPVWALIPKPSDWRWLVDRDDSPWYPTFRLFRQRTSGDWPPVIERVTKELSKVAQSGTLNSYPKEPTARATRVNNPSERTFVPSHFGGITETRHGIMQYLPESAVLATALELYGEYLQPQIDFLRSLVASGKTIVEVASGVGAHTLSLAALASDVIAYETNAIARRVLRQNLRANKIQNVTVLPAATLGNSPATQTSADVIAIDALALKELSLIKINEPTLIDDAIRSAEDTLWRLRPVVFAALLNNSQQMEARTRIAAFGYRCWSIETPFFNPANFNQRAENTFEDRSAFALLAIPEELDIDAPSLYHEL
jgi:tetratricopeptide (TPR) repeat protein